MASSSLSLSSLVQRPAAELALRRTAPTWCLHPPRMGYPCAGTQRFLGSYFKNRQFRILFLRTGPMAMHSDFCQHHTWAQGVEDCCELQRFHILFIEGQSDNTEQTVERTRTSAPCIYSHAKFMINAHTPTNTYIMRINTQVCHYVQVQAHMCIYTWSLLPVLL